MNEKNPLLKFFVGIGMLGAGLYWLFNSVEVTSGLGFGFGLGHSIAIGGMNIPSGLTVVPLILGVFWWVIQPDSFFPKALTVVGVVVIVAAIIMSVQLRFRTRTLYEYIIMLILIVVGAGLLARVLLFGDGKKETKTKNK